MPRQKHRLRDATGTLSPGAQDSPSPASKVKESAGAVAAGAAGQRTGDEVADAPAAGEGMLEQARRGSPAGASHSHDLRYEESLIRAKLRERDRVAQREKERKAAQERRKEAAALERREAAAEAARRKKAEELQQQQEEERQMREEKERKEMELAEVRREKERKETELSELRRLQEEEQARRSDEAETRAAQVRVKAEQKAAARRQQEEYLRKEEGMWQAADKQPREAQQEAAAALHVVGELAREAAAVLQEQHTADEHTADESRAPLETEFNGPKLGLLQLAFPGAKTLAEQLQADGELARTAQEAPHQLLSLPSLSPNAATTAPASAVVEPRPRTAETPSSAVHGLCTEARAHADGEHSHVGAIQQANLVPPPPASPPPPSPAAKDVAVWLLERGSMRVRAQTSEMVARCGRMGMEAMDECSRGLDVVRR
jgi:hypothetical protein